jgi:hypothetical protein
VPNQIGCPFRYRDHGSIGISANDARHDGGIGHPEALAHAVTPPLMIATLPSKFDMILPSVCVPGSGDDVEMEMGPPASGVQCGGARIGGAKAIRLND